MQRQAMAALLPDVEPAADAKRVGGRAAHGRKVYVAGLPEMKALVTRQSRRSSATSPAQNIAAHEDNLTSTAPAADAQS